MRVRVPVSAVSVLVMAYGLYLLATIGDEFDPRGRVGLAALGVGVAGLALAVRPAARRAPWLVVALSVALAAGALTAAVLLVGWLVGTVP